MLRSLRVSDRISLGALGTAVIASVVGVMQTGFMYVARNDEVEAALRSEQLRACSAYRIAGFNLHARARWLSVDGVPIRDDGFGALSQDYGNAISQLNYLLPSGHEATLALAEVESTNVWGAFIEKDREALRDFSDEQGVWAQAHAEILEICDIVIRDVRDNRGL
jgi:hypothetical protein